MNILLECWVVLWESSLKNTNFLTDLYWIAHFSIKRCLFTRYTLQVQSCHVCMSCNNSFRTATHVTQSVVAWFIWITRLNLVRVMPVRVVKIINFLEGILVLDMQTNSQNYSNHYFFNEEKNPRPFWTVKNMTAIFFS